MQRARELGTLSPKKGLHQTPPFRLKGPCRKGDRNNIKARADGGYQERMTILTHRDGTYMNSQRLSQHAQGPHGSAPGGVCGGLNRYDPHRLMCLNA